MIASLPEGCEVTSIPVERVRVVGRGGDGLRNEVLGILHAAGYRVTRSGAYTDAKMFPKVDVSRFLIIAEREMTP